MFFPSRRDAARAVSQSSRDESEVRGGECGVRGNVARLVLRCRWDVQPLPELHLLRNSPLFLCAFALALHPENLCSAQHVASVLPCSQGDVSQCHSVSEPSALFSPLSPKCSPFPAPTGTATSLLVLQLHPCFVTCPGAAPYLPQQCPTILPTHGSWWAFSTTLSPWCRSPLHVPTLLQ